MTFAVPLGLITAAALAAGCDGGGADGEATPGVSPVATIEEVTATATLAAATATSTAQATLTPAPDIRQQDLTEQMGLREFLASGGEVDPSEIVYADLTEDGVEEAVVSVASGGTAGNIAVFVFGYGPGGLRELLRELPPEEAYSGHIGARVESGQLIVSWPIYGPDDANCCPSQGRRERTYRWDGSALVVEREELTERS